MTDQPTTPRPEVPPIAAREPDPTETARPRHIDPAQEAMETNPNLSPPIHPRPN